MAQYTVQAPDGKTITLEGPDGASHEDVIAQAQQLYQPPQQEQEQEYIDPTLTAAIGGLAGTGLAAVSGGKQALSAIPKALAGEKEGTLGYYETRVKNLTPSVNKIVSANPPVQEIDSLTNAPKTNISLGSEDHINQLIAKDSNLPTAEKKILSDYKKWSMGFEGEQLKEKALDWVSRFKKNYPTATFLGKTAERVLAPIAAGYDAADAYNRAQQAKKTGSSLDALQAGIAAVGAGSSIAAPFTEGLSIPIVGGGATLANYAIDKLRNSPVKPPESRKVLVPAPIKP